MIKDKKLLRDFEDRLLRERKPDFFSNLRIYEALYQEAVRLGVLPGDDPLEGIEVKIKLAKALNSVR